MMTFHLAALFFVSLIVMPAVLFFVRTRRKQKMLILGIVVCLFLWSLFAASVCWYLRDGLGPDSIDSHGTLAWHRFAEVMLPVAVCWPTQPSKPDMELFVPLLANGAPMINTYQGYVAACSQYQPDCILYIQAEIQTTRDITHQLELYYWNRSSRLQIGDVINKTKDHPAVLSLVPTKDGAGSSLAVLQSSSSGLLPYAEFPIKERPQIFTGEWWSPSARFGYIAMIFTVPLDVLTLPIQLYAGVVIGNMNHGMSPK